MKTKQETFDIVAKFLLEQGGPSVDSEKDQCLYRGPNGLKCAAGCLIPDEFYDPIMDTSNEVFGAIYTADSELISTILKNQGYDSQFVKCLQEIHDCNSYCWNEWKDDMIEFAKDEGLSWEVLQ